MPVYLRPNELFVKNPNGTGYLPQNVISQTSTSEILEAFDQTVENTQESLNTMTSEAQQAVDGIESQKNTMIASIASVAGQGTDTTLTQSGVAADAKVVGDLKSAIETIDPSVIDNNLLLGFPYVNRSSNGITITGNVGTGITMTGTCSGNTAIRMFGDSSAVSLKAGKTYLYYAKHTGSIDISSTTWQPVLRLSTSAGSDKYRQLHEDGVMFSVESDVNVIPFVRCLSGLTITGSIVFYPVLVEYETYIKSIIKNVIDKTAPNMFERSLFMPTATGYGVTMTNNLDGTYTVDGKENTGSVSTLSLSNPNGILLERGKTYIYASNGNQNITVGEDTYRMDIRKVSASRTVVSYETEFGGLFIPDETTLYRFMLRFKGSYEFDDLVIRPTLYDCAEYDFGNDCSGKFRVCSYNVGNFSLGSSGEASGNDSIYRGLIKSFSNCDANVYMFSEWDEYWNYSESKKSENVFSKFKPYHSKWFKQQTGYIAQMNYFDFPIVAEEHFYFNDGHSRHLVDNVILMKGIPVHFICTHMNAYDLQSRYDNYDKIFTYIQSNNIEHYVIAGDFNHGIGGTGTILETARDEIDYVEAKGAISIQGGFYGSIAHDGFINTYKSGNDVDDIRPYDNIFISSNIRIKNVFKVTAQGTTADPLGSDHYPLCAELEIL